MIAKFSTKKWQIVLAGMGFSLWCTVIGSPCAEGAGSADVQILLPKQEKILYVPIEGDGEQVQEVRKKEGQAIQRFFRTRGLAEIPLLTHFDAPEIFQQVEPALLMEERERRCTEKKSAARPIALLREAQAAFAEGNPAKARRQMTQLRTQLPCVPHRLPRQQLAEFLLWMGLVSPDIESEEAQSFLRGALSTDPLLVDSERIPERVIEKVRKVSYELENNLRPVDVHLPQGEGDMWTHKNLLLDGRRLVFDKLFTQVMPGTHFLQITLPNDRVLGTFFTIAAGTTPDLAQLARRQLHIDQLYSQQFTQALAAGYASSALTQGFKLYAIKLKRDYFYLTSITDEEDGTWLTVRRFHIDRGIEVPELDSLPSDQGVTASVPISLFQPWAVETSFSFTALTGGQTDIRSSSGSFELDAFYLFSKRIRLGLDLGLGGRSYRLLDAGGNSSLRADSDFQVGASIGAVIPIGNSDLLPDLGYARHLVPLRGLPMYCSDIPTVEPGNDPVYQCGFSQASNPNSQVFNLRSSAAGPRLRIGLAFKPFSQGNITLRGLFRVAYSPMIVSLNKTIGIDLTTQDPSGGEEIESAILAIDEESQRWLIHQLGFSLGINGSY